MKINYPGNVMFYWSEGMIARHYFIYEHIRMGEPEFVDGQGRRMQPPGGPVLRKDGIPTPDGSKLLIDRILEWLDYERGDPA